MANLAEQMKIEEANNNELLSKFNGVHKERDNLQAKITEAMYRLQKYKDEVEERDEKI